MNNKGKAPTAVRQAEDTKRTINFNIAEKPKKVNPVFTGIFKAFGFRG